MRCFVSFSCLAREEVLLYSLVKQLKNPVHKAQGEFASVLESKKLTGSDRHIGETDWEQNHMCLNQTLWKLIMARLLIVGSLTSQEAEVVFLEALRASFSKHSLSRQA